MVFTFLVNTGGCWNNDEAQTETPQGVRFRMISGGRSSLEGARYLERMMVIDRTCREQGIQFVKVLAEEGQDWSILPLALRRLRNKGDRLRSRG